MADKIKKNGTSLGEISTIRNILMGQQISEYESRFQEVQSQLAEFEKRMSQHVESQIMESEKRMKLESDKLLETLTNKVAVVEESLKRYVQELNVKVDRNSDQERVRLGNLLADLSNQLLNGK